MTVIDANMLILFIVGAADNSQIRTVKGTQTFDSGCYDLLLHLIGDDEIATTPNVLTEASNILDRTKNANLRKKIMDAFRVFAARSEERYLQSKTVCSLPEFDVVGLSDAVLVCLGKEGWRLITTDLELWQIARKAGVDAINFNHYR